MVGRLSLTLFTVLFLFGCASSNKNTDKIGIEESEKTVVDRKNKSSIKNICDLDEVLLKVHNQKEAVEFLGEPVEKSVYILEWNIKNKPFLEYVENWKWKKPNTYYILFNKEGKVHNKINILVMTGDYNKDKELKNLRLNNI